MKKVIPAILALLTVLSIGTVCAAEPAKAEKDKPAAATEAAEETQAAVIPVLPDIGKRSVRADRDAVRTPQNPDTVTIDEEKGVFSVITASGTELSVTVPFGVYCITQDVAQQLDVYLNLYADVGAALKTYLDQGIHMDLYDFYAGKSVYICELENPFAAVTGDLNKLSLTNRKQAGDYLSEHRFGNYSAQLKRVGKNAYIAFDLAQDCGFVVYDTIVGGKLIEIYTFCDKGRDGMVQIEKMISTLTIGQPAPAAGEDPEPEEALPVETVPVETAPTETVPVETLPEETVPAETVTEESTVAETEPEETAAK